MLSFCVFQYSFFFFQAEDGIRDVAVTGVQTCALPICAAARVRENTCLLEFPARLFLAQYERNSNLQHAIHQSLLRSLARTNTQLTRLISHARLTSSTRAALELEKALHAQVVNVKNQ